ncbi:uncharacterized protein MELLADRAFT_107565 [Melampsora larici-populina 98AG31]|uniref:Secreted protein n=1 Tax=Melampsora larici-populina (strain 98AG31 / pathotype 3-4-7) TaxID=747676 RepID=F4RQ25_MELLP|nr:uncharacterized protein MELLADRAFT_107565 [Melampsora larici-populina 98AG31]EGG05332.1 hypothetical protein MELLADRAFT_107565 [Melampsora larici-populina 98AG31]
MKSILFLILVFNSFFHFLKASDWTGPYLVCSGSVEMGWIARSDAKNAYDFAKSKRGISSGDSTKYKRLGRCRCIQASSGDWYANCFDGLTPDGQTIGQSALPRQDRLSPFQNNFPALCFASDACPDDALKGVDDSTPIVKQYQPQLVCANGIPLGLIDGEQNFRESMAKDPLATSCSCRSAGSAVTINGTQSQNSTPQGYNATMIGNSPIPLSTGNTGSGDGNSRIQLVCEQQFADSIFPYCAAVGTGCGTNLQWVGYQK